MAKENKVFFGMRDLHIAYMKEDSTQGNPTYEEPIAIPGAVSFSPSADISDYTFNADDTKYYVARSNNGYSGELSMAKFPDEVLVVMLGWVLDKSGALVETTAEKKRSFAMMFTVSGDKRGRRVIFYNCTGSAPNEGFATSQDNPTVQPQTMTVDVLPVNLGVDLGTGDDRILKAVVEYNSEKPDVYNNFFKKPYIPEPVEPGI